MKKNMYSLMLTEEIVSEIDRIAAAKGTSRSGLINAILAEYVSYRTPEMRMNDMFDRMELMLKKSGGIETMMRSSDSLFQLRSMLAYKYNPAVNYSVELYRIMTDAIGEIRVSLRTQNERLKLYLMQFYKLWAGLEKMYLTHSDCAADGGKFVKRLVIPGGNSMGEEELCIVISEYITAFDSALKAFFKHLDDADMAVRTVKEIYLSYYTGCRSAL